MILDSFYGNFPLKQHLKHAIENQTLSHAILIEGETGLGAGYLSELIAASILCAHGGCGQCRSCQKFKKGIHPDIIILDKENAMITVDDIRNIGSSAYIYPNDCDKKVYIIKNAHNMNPKAQNALLKLLEEPPSFVSFILSVEKKDKLLDTVLSRCVCLKVEPVKADEIEHYLINELKIKPSEAKVTASRSFGFIGMAISLLKKRTANRSLGKKELCLDMLETLCFKDEFTFLKFQKKLSDERDKEKNDGSGEGAVFDIMALLLSDILYTSTGKEPSVFTSSEEKERLSRLCEAVNPSDLPLLYIAAEDTKQQILRKINYTACINSFLVRAWEVIHG